MNLKQVTKDILDWSERWVEVPHPALGGWPPCPYARQARLNNRVGILLGDDPYFDLEKRSESGLGSWEVCIYAYDPSEWSYENFGPRIHAANRDFLLSRDLLALDDHPDDPEVVNGITMNQGQYALVLVQSLSELNSRARQIAAKGFYKSWPEPYLQQLFANREDPRS